MIRGLNKLTAPDGLGYLMSSYTSHPDGFDAAELQAREIAADMLRAGLVVFAPIAYGPGIDKLLTVGMHKEDADYFRSHEFWMPICERFFERCDYGIIATTPGWHKSQGIAIEFYALTQGGVPIWFYDWDEAKILNYDEAAKKWEREMEEFLRRAAELKDTHLNSATYVMTEAIAMVIV
jgi:hypothetical protein